MYNNLVKSYLSTQIIAVSLCIKYVMELTGYRTDMQKKSFANVLRKNEGKNLQILCGAAACQEVLSTRSTRTRTGNVVHSCLI